MARNESTVFSTMLKLIKDDKCYQTHDRIRKKVHSQIDKRVATYQPPIIWLWGDAGCGKSLTAKGLANLFAGETQVAEVRGWDEFYDAIMNNAQIGLSGYTLFSTVVVDEVGKCADYLMHEIKFLHILGDSKVWTPTCKINKNQGKSVKTGLVIMTSNCNPKFKEGFSDPSVLRRMAVVKQEFDNQPLYKHAGRTYDYKGLVTLVTNFLVTAVANSRSLSDALKTPKQAICEINSLGFDEEEDYIPHFQ
jgi:hypothetical protein